MFRQTCGIRASRRDGGKTLPHQHQTQKALRQLGGKRKKRRRQKRGEKEEEEGGRDRM